MFWCGDRVIDETDKDDAVLFDQPLEEKKEVFITKALFISSFKLEEPPSVLPKRKSKVIWESFIRLPERHAFSFRKNWDNYKKGFN